MFQKNISFFLSIVSHKQCNLLVIEKLSMPLPMNCEYDYSFEFDWTIISE